MPLALVALLHFTGLLASVSYAVGTVLLKTGILNASTEAPAVIRDFDYDFALQDLKGNVINVEQMRGKVLFVNIWATWCGPCRIEMPSIDALYSNADTSRVAFLMISVDDAENRSGVSEFIAGKEFTFPVYMPASSLPSLLQVRSIPSTFIIAPDGKVAMQESGLTNFNTDRVRKLLKSL